MFSFGYVNFIVILRHARILNVSLKSAEEVWITYTGVELKPVGG